METPTSDGLKGSGVCLGGTVGVSGCSLCECVLYDCGGDVGDARCVSFYLTAGKLEVSS